MATAAKVKKQLDYEFVIENEPGTSLVQIKLAHTRGAAVPARLSGLWSSRSLAERMISDWRAILASSISEDNEMSDITEGSQAEE